jgi:hypothetical protein
MSVYRDFYQDLVFAQTFGSEQNAWLPNEDSGNDVLVEDSMGATDSLGPLRLFISAIIAVELVAADSIAQFAVFPNLLTEEIETVDADPVYRYWVPSGLPQSVFTEISAGRESPFVESMEIFDEWVSGYSFAGLQVFSLVGGAWFAGEQLKLMVSGEWKIVNAIHVVDGGSWKE